MLNSDPVTADADPARPQAALSQILRSGATGAVVLAGIATAVVLLLWVAFYLLVFVPRAAP
jgi:hypothetical protein